MNERRSLSGTSTDHLDLKIIPMVGADEREQLPQPYEKHRHSRRLYILPLRESSDCHKVNLGQPSFNFGTHADAQIAEGFLSRGRYWA